MWVVFVELHREPMKITCVTDCIWARVVGPFADSAKAIVLDRGG